MRISVIAPITSSLRGSIFLKTPGTRAPPRALNSPTACRSQLNAIPGVQSVAFGSDYVPRGMHQISVAGQLEKQSSNVATQDIGASGFATLGIPLLRGRTFDARDRENAQPVAWQWQKSILISGIREEMRI